MAFNAGSAVGYLKIDSTSWDKGVKDASSGAKQIDSSFKSVSTTAATTNNSFKTLFATFFTANIATSIVNKGVSLVKDTMIKSIKISTDLAESTNKLNVTFSSISKEATAVKNNLVNAYGLSRLESTKLLSATGDLLTGFGFTQDKALGLSESVQKLAVDLASFQNLEGGSKQASEALTKALLGETESAKSLGIVIRETDVISRLAAQGKDKLTGMSLLQAKAEERLKIAVEQSKNAIGDYARTSESLANVQRTLSARFDDLLANLGERFLPTMTLLTSKTLSFVSSLVKITDVKAGEEIQKEQENLNLLVTELTSANTSEDRRLNIILELNKNYKNFVGNLDLEKASIKEIGENLRLANDEYINKIIIAKEDEKITKQINKQKNAAVKARELELKGLAAARDLAIDMKIENKLLGLSLEEQIIYIKKHMDALKARGKSVDVNSWVMLTNKLELYQKAQMEVVKLESGINNMNEEKKKLIEALDIKIESNTVTTKDNTSEIEKNIDVIEKQNEVIKNSKPNKPTAKVIIGDVEKDDSLGQMANILGSFEGLFTNTSSNISNNIGGLFNNMIDGFSNVVDYFKNGAGNIGETFNAVFQAVASMAQSVLGSVSEIITSQYENEISLLEIKFDKEKEMRDEQQELNLERIQNDGLTNEEFLIKEIEDLQAAINTETDATAKADLIEQLSSKQKDMEIFKSKRDYENLTNKEEKKLAKEKYKREVEIFNAKKGMDIANVWIGAAAGIVAAWSSAAAWPGPSMIAGLALAGVMTGLITTAAAVQTGFIASQQPPTPAFKTGGIVQGPGGVDNVPIMATAGELILNAGQQSAVADRLTNSNEENRNDNNAPYLIQLLLDGSVLSEWLYNQQRRDAIAL